MAKTRTVLSRVGLVLLLLGTASLDVSVLAPSADARSRTKQPAVAAPVPISPAPSNLPLLEPFPTDTAPKPDLTIGNLHAAVSTSDSGTVLAVGSSGVITVSVTDAGGNRSVTLLAESEAGDIRAISGRGVRTSKVRGGLAADVPLLTSGTTTATIEFVLKAGARGPDGKARDRVRVTLLPQKGGKDVSIVGWPLSDCAGDYYAELQRILLDRRPRMMSTLDAVVETDSALPSIWYFPPAKITAGPACKPRKGKKSVGCSTAKTDASSNDEGLVLSTADQILHDKGALAAYQHRGTALRQVSYNLLSSLRTYMEQDRHPALCSGVADMVEYYTVHTPLLRNTITESRQMRIAAETLAAAKIAELMKTAAIPAAAQPQQASNGSGLVSVADAAEMPTAKNTMAVAQLDQMSKAILRPSDTALVAGDKDALSKLQRLRGLMDSAATADLTSERRTLAIAALGMVEASLYLDAAEQKYDRLDETIYGTMSAIKDAHAKTCVCTQ